MVSKLSKQYYSFHEPEKYHELAAQCEGRRAKALSSNERKYYARQAAIFRQLANRKAPQKTSPAPNGLIFTARQYIRGERGGRTRYYFVQFLSSGGKAAAYVFFQRSSSFAGRL
jgi:hypothetical protein